MFAGLDGKGSIAELQQHYSNKATAGGSPPTKVWESGDKNLGR